MVGSRKSYRSFPIFVAGLLMTKKDGSSKQKSIEEVRAATQADVKRITNTPARVASERKHVKNSRSILA
jgi:hypothetical protein